MPNTMPNTTRKLPSIVTNSARKSWRDPHRVSKPAAAFQLGACPVILYTLHLLLWYRKEHSAVAQIKACHNRLEAAVEAVAFSLPPTVLPYIREHLLALRKVSDDFIDRSLRYRLDPAGFEEEDGAFGYPDDLGRDHCYDFIARIDDALRDQPALRAYVRLGREVVSLDPLYCDPQSVSTPLFGWHTPERRRPSPSLIQIAEDDGGLLDPLLAAIEAAPAAAREQVPVFARAVALKEKMNPRRCKTFLKEWLDLDDAVAEMKPADFLAKVVARLLQEAEEGLSRLTEEGLAAAPTSVPREEPASTRPVFRLCGTRWLVGWKGVRKEFPDELVGFGHIHVLLSSQGRRVDVLDFPENGTPEAAASKKKMRARARRVEADEVGSPRESGAGDWARLVYLETKMGEVQRAISEAQEEGDGTMERVHLNDFQPLYEEATELRDRLKPIKKGKYGKVKKAIDRVIEVLAEEGEPEFREMAKHLEKAINPATYGLIYAPESNVDWEL